jgi:hypothetical protein
MIFAKDPANPGKFLLYLDINSCKTKSNIFVETEPSEYLSLISAWESNARLCPVCNANNLMKQSTVLLPFDKEPTLFRKECTIISCDCRKVWITRAKIAGKSVYYKRIRQWVSSTSQPDIAEDRVAMPPAAAPPPARDREEFVTDTVIRVVRPSRFITTERFDPPTINQAPFRWTIVHPPRRAGIGTGTGTVAGAITTTTTRAIPPTPPRGFGVEEEQAQPTPPQPPQTIEEAAAEREAALRRAIRAAQRTHR